LGEIRILVCTFLHELFIDNLVLMKIVHFQGYEPSLLRITIDGIPSV